MTPRLPDPIVIRRTLPPCVTAIEATAAVITLPVVVAVPCLSDPRHNPLRHDPNVFQPILRRLTNAVVADRQVSDGDIRNAWRTRPGNAENV